ncbi:MAG: hypothetical protein AABZ15_14945 [Nitrospirota bacterium]
MGKRQLLFVTYRDENIEEGGMYAIELAKAMYEDITLLLVEKKDSLISKLGNMMTAASFAESGEQETAREILSQGAVREKHRVDRVANLMTAVTFAEAGEQDSARRYAAESTEDIRKNFKEKLDHLTALCRKDGIAVRVEDSKQEAVAGIKSYLRDHSGIDKVVLSPAVTSDNNVSAKDLNRLVRTASRPIVTMTRQACCTA